MATPMVIDSGAEKLNAPGSAAPAQSSASSSQAPTDLDQHIGKMQLHKDKSAVAQVLKMLKNLQKAPSEEKNRKFPTSHLLIAKYVKQTPGAMEVMKAIGFGENGKYFQVTDVNSTVLEQIVNTLENTGQSSSSSSDAPKPATGAAVAAAPKPFGGPRPVCPCGFFGDPNTDNLCSSCYKKRSVTGDSKDVGPKKCVKGCGNFAGGEKYLNMCSSCFKKRQDKTVIFKKRLRSCIVKLKAVRRFRLQLKSDELTTKTRCFACRKRVGISGISCKCNRFFCGNHRFPENHDCPSIEEFRKSHLAKLEKQNPKLSNQKLDKME